MNNHLLEQPAPPSGNGETDTSTQPLRKRDKILKALGFKSEKKVRNKVSQQTEVTPSESSPLLVSVQNNLDIEDDLRAMMLHRLQEAQLQVYIPPMAKASLQALDKEVFSLKDKVYEFLTSDRQVMLLLGDSGAGKSTFNKQLESDLLRAYKRGGSIPLFINLPVLEKPAKNLIAKQLKEYNFSDVQIQQLRQHRQFIVICDGYDESQLTVNLHTSNNFNRPGQWKVKLIISCRTQYLGPDYRNCFMPQGTNHYNLSGHDIFQEAVVVPFSVEQIQDYVQKYVPLEPRTWSTKDYMERLNEIPNLMDLVKNPFLLSLALEALPDFTEGQQDISAIKITRARLYDIFIAHWLDVNKRRLQRNNLLKDDRITLGQLLEAGFVTMGIDYSKRLALAMFENQNGKAVVQYIHLKDKTKWKVNFFGPDPEVRLLREASPLTRSGTFFQFLHRSMLEYFLSCTVVGPSTSAPVDECAPQATLDSSGVQSLDPVCPLFTRSLLGEPSVVKFLSERVHENTRFKDQLLEVVERSKTDASMAIAAANAMTILVRAGMILHRHDFRGIRIPGADLSVGQFDSTQFQGADLRNVNLAMSWLRNADFSNAQMEGVQFGELPYLEEAVDVWTCLYSPQEKMLAVGLEDGGLALYDTSTWKKIRSLLGHKDDLKCLGFSLDGQRLVSGSKDRTVRVWDCSSGDLLATMSGHDGSVLSVAFSRCGKYVASGSQDGVVRSWAWATGEPLFVLEDHTGGVNTINFTPDGRLLAACGTDGTIRFWDAEIGAPSDVWELGYGSVTCMEFSPDGRQLISGHIDGNLRLWDTMSGSPGPVLRGHTDMVVQVRFSPDGQLIASGGIDSTVRLWDSSLCTLISLYSTSRPVFDVSFSSDGLTPALADSCNKVRLWDGSSNGSSVGQPGHSYSVESVAYLPTGQSVISGGLDKTVRQWDALTGALETTHVLTGLSSELIILQKLSPDLQQSAYCFDETIQLQDFQTGVIEFVLEGHTEDVRTVAHSQCGRWIASTSNYKSVRLWDLHNGGQSHVLIETVAEFNAASGAESYSESSEDEVDAESEKNEPDEEPGVDEPDGDEPDAQSEVEGSDVEFDDAAFDADSEDEGPSPFALAFTSTGLRLAVGFIDGTVNIYTTQSKELLTTTTIGDKGVRALAYSPNNLELAIGCHDGVVVFWDLQSDEPGHILHFGTDAVCCITYSPWKDWLAFGGDDMRVHLCRRRQSQSESSDMEALWCVVFVAEGFLDWVRDIAWNPVVRNEFATGCMDRSVRVWRISESDDGGDGSVSVKMVWGSSIGILGAVGMRLDGVVGLDAGSLKLLRQRGAVGDFSAFEKDEADVGSDRVLDFSYGEGWNDISNDGSLAGMDE